MLPLTNNIVPFKLKITCKRCARLITPEFDGCGLPGCLQVKEMGKNRNKWTRNPRVNIVVFHAKDLTKAKIDIISTIPEEENIVAGDTSGLPWEFDTTFSGGIAAPWERYTQKEMEQMSVDQWNNEIKEWEDSQNNECCPV